MLNKIFIFLFLFSSLYATRIDKSFEMMHKKSILKYAKIVPISAKNSYSSKHFTIYWGNKIPSTNLWIDENNNSIPDFIENSASILESVWDTEVNDFGFNKPSNKKIDVFMANTGVVLDGEDVELTDEYCGYTAKNDDYKYMVINDIPPSSYYTKSMDMLKVTLAHEFFHLIQYTYNDNYLQKDKWLYEGTAVLMENLVFPQIPDYVHSYAGTIFNNPNYGIVYPFSLVPYASVLFFDYLYNKYGLEIIKDIWTNMKTMDSINAIDIALKKNNSNFKNALTNFYQDLESNLNAFSNTSLLTEFKISKTSISKISNQKSLYLYNFGAIYFETNQSISLALLDKSSSLDKNKKINFRNTQSKIVVNYNDLNSSYHLSKLYANKTEINIKIIKKGWNLLSFAKDINVSSLDKYPIQRIWSYKNGEWLTYPTENNSYDFKELKKIDITNGVWIYAKKSFYMTFDKSQIGEFTYKVNGWELLSFPVNLKLYNNEILETLNVNLVWQYNNNNWNYYSTDYKINNKLNENNLTKFNKIEPYQGYWIRN